MSFVDMLANHVWTDAEITNRTEAMVRSVMPLVDELVLNRKVQGAALGQYTLTPEDQADMERLAAAGMAAQQAGIEARYDMLVLREVWLVEEAEKRLSLPVIEPILDEEGNVTNQDEIDADTTGRVAAQERIDVSDEDVMRWVEARRPPPVEEPVEEPIVEEPLPEEPA